jgi:serine/threonine protein kinase
MEESPKKKFSEDPLDGLDSIVRPLSEEDSPLGADPDLPKVGTLFAGRYEILSEGLRGGMGVVYKCKDSKLNTIKALKVIHPKLLSAEEAVQRFRQEVSISQKLQHKNIVRVYDLDEYNGIEFFTMEWVEGKSLRGLITERKKQNKLFTLGEAYKIISQISDALQHAHKYTIHRDVKPEKMKKGFKPS